MSNTPRGRDNRLDNIVRAAVEQIDRLRDEGFLADVDVKDFARTMARFRERVQQRRYPGKGS